MNKMLLVSLLVMSVLLVSSVYYLPQDKEESFTRQDMKLSTRGIMIIDFDNGDSIKEESVDGMIISRTFRGDVS